MVQIKAVFNSDADKIESQVRSIENELNEPLNVAQCTNLFRRLDTTQQTLKRIPIGTRSQATALEKLDGRIVTLFGKISEKALDSEVKEIQERASYIETPEERELLEDEIGTLYATHTLSPEYRRILSWARTTLQSKSAASTVNHFEWIAAQKPQINFLDTFELGEIEDLFEIAVWFEAGNRKEAKIGFNQLSETARRKVKQHCENLGGALFENPLETIQTFIAAAHDLAGTFEGYYSALEVAEFFAERRELAK